MSYLRGTVLCTPNTFCTPSIDDRGGGVNDDLAPEYYSGAYYSNTVRIGRCDTDRPIAIIIQYRILFSLLFVYFFLFL